MTEGKAFSQQLNVAGATSYSDATLPTGVTLSSSGVLTGTATAFTKAGVNVSTLTLTNAAGTTRSPLLLVAENTAQDETGLKLNFQDGVSPSLNYATTSAGIAQDTSNASLANEPSSTLLVGLSTTTQDDRALLGFDLSSLPKDATVSAAQLTLQGTATASLPVELHSTSAFNPLTATWTLNSSYNATVLSSATVPASSGTDSWTTGTNFVSALQSNLGNELDLMLVSPTAESGTTAISATFTSEQNSSSASRPVLALTYSTAAPPVLLSLNSIAIASGTTVSTQLPFISNTESIVATGLPSGLTLSSTGLLSGVPTPTSGSFTATITATNKNGASIYSIPISIGSAPVITSATTKSGAAGTAFTYTITATNTPTSYTASGLPAGLTLSTAGVISGTLSASSAGSYPIELTATNAFGTASSSLQLTVTGTPALSGPVTIYANVGVPFSYSVSATNLPTGLVVTGISSSVNLTTSGLSLSGTPTTAGTFAGTIAAKNTATGTAVSLTVTVTALPVPSFTDQSISVVSGQSFSHQITATVATAANSAPQTATTYAATGLPTGLTISSTGLISGTVGTVTAVTNKTVTVTAKDAAGTGTGTFTFTVYPAGPGIGSPLTLSGQLNQLVSYDLTAITGTPTSGTMTNLPPGITYDPGVSGLTVGQLQGAPTETGVFNIAVSITNSAGQTSTGTLVFTVSDISSAVTSTCYVGQTNYSFQVTDTKSPTNFFASNLPAGLSINSTTGLISGVPLVSETNVVNLVVQDAAGSQVGQVTITVNPNPANSQITYQNGVSPSSSYTAQSAAVEDNFQNPTVGNTSYSASPSFTLGEANSTEYNAILEFSLPNLPPNATITSASLVLTPQSSGSSGSTLGVEVYSISPVNLATATFNNTNTLGQRSLLTSVSVDPSNLPATVTTPPATFITQAVQDAYISNQPIYLYLQQEPSSGTSAVAFANLSTASAENPTLVVTYTTAAATTAPVITSSGILTGTVSQALSPYLITATESPTSYALAQGTSPAVTLTGNKITGTITKVGSFPYTMSATNSLGTGTQGLQINIDSATPANGLAITSGNNQTIPPAGQTAPLVVTATRGGTALANCLVTFTTANGSLSPTTTGATSQTLAVVTNASGQASVYWNAPNASGPFYITATSGTSTPVTFIETASELPSGQQAGLVLSVIRGQGQSGSSGSTLGSPFVIQAVNYAGQPISGQAITCAVTSGGGTLTATSLTTNSAGQASTTLKLGAGPTNLVTATATLGGKTDTVYLNALTVSGEVTTPGTSSTVFDFSTDPDPMDPSGFNFINIATPSRNYVSPVGDEVQSLVQDFTTVTIPWIGYYSDQIYVIQRKDTLHPDWETVNIPPVIVPVQNAYDDSITQSGLLSGVDYTYRIREYSNNVIVETTYVDYFVPEIAAIGLHNKRTGIWTDQVFVDGAALDPTTYDEYKLIFNPSMQGNPFIWYESTVYPAQKNFEVVPREASLATTESPAFPINAPPQGQNFYTYLSLGNRLSLPNYNGGTPIGNMQTISDVYGINGYGGGGVINKTSLFYNPILAATLPFKYTQYGAFSLNVDLQTLNTGDTGGDPNYRRIVQFSITSENGNASDFSVYSTNQSGQTITQLVTQISDGDVFDQDGTGTSFTVHGTSGPDAFNTSNLFTVIPGSKAQNGETITITTQEYDTLGNYFGSGSVTFTYSNPPPNNC